jgi:hypothetical protein
MFCTLQREVHLPFVDDSEAGPEGRALACVWGTPLLRELGTRFLLQLFLASIGGRGVGMQRRKLTFGYQLIKTH